MKPIDYRNATFDRICGHLTGMRQTVYTALHDHGPCTTAQLAYETGISILTIRPRVTELCQLGLARLSAPSAPLRETSGKSHAETAEIAEGRGSEGTYEAVELADVRETVERRRRELEAAPVQMDLRLTA